MQPFLPPCKLQQLPKRCSLTHLRPDLTGISAHEKGIICAIVCMASAVYIESQLLIQCKCSHIRTAHFKDGGVVIPGPEVQSPGGSRYRDQAGQVWWQSLTS